MKTFLKTILGKELIAFLWHKPKAVCAAFLYGFPARHFTVIAVAGTKGKTSTAYFISQFLDAAGIPNALFCTAALKIKGEESLNTLKLTTPTPFFFQQFARRARVKGCTHLIVEVSSHALVQERLWGVPFHIAVLTNLTPDHLEYHQDARDYQETHRHLITKNLRALILNGDDEHLAPFTSLSVQTIPVRNNDATYQSVALKIHLKGSFQIMNASLAYAAARATGIGDSLLAHALPSLTGAPGRMETIENDRGVDIVVDYAHSVESLTTFFASIRPSVREQLIAVFGACGERDVRQRPLMGARLDAYADRIIVTNDDPYSEDPKTIAHQLKEGITRKKEGEALFTILDRREAITKALAIAKRGDTICILGKGAEQWQVFSNKKIPWDDRRIVKDILEQLPHDSC